MKKIVAMVLCLLLVLSFTGCNKGEDTMYELGIMVDGMFYEKSYQPMPAEVDESAIIGRVSSYTEAFPEKDGETNISEELIDAPYAKVEGGIAILIGQEWYLCKSDEQ